MCQFGNKAMKIKLTYIKRKGKKEKKEQICKVRQWQIKKIYIKINCKGKRAIGKANKGINVEKIVIGLKKLKLKKEKKKTPQNCKSPMQRQRFITTIKNMTEEERKS